MESGCLQTHNKPDILKVVPKNSRIRKMNKQIRRQSRKDRNSREWTQKQMNVYGRELLRAYVMGRNSVLEFFGDLKLRFQNRTFRDCEKLHHKMINKYKSTQMIIAKTIGSQRRAKVDSQLHKISGVPIHNDNQLNLIRQNQHMTEFSDKLKQNQSTSEILSLDRQEEDILEELLMCYQSPEQHYFDGFQQDAEVMELQEGDSCMEESSFQGDF